MTKKDIIGALILSGIICALSLLRKPIDWMLDRFLLWIMDNPVLIIPAVFFAGIVISSIMEIQRERR